MNKNSLQLYGEVYEARYSTMDEFLGELKKKEYEYEVYKGDFLPNINDIFK